MPASAASREPLVEGQREKEEVGKQPPDNEETQSLVTQIARSAILDSRSGCVHARYRIQPLRGVGSSLGFGRRHDRHPGRHGARLRARDPAAVGDLRPGLRRPHHHPAARVTDHYEVTQRYARVPQPPLTTPTRVSRSRRSRRARRGSSRCSMATRPRRMVSLRVGSIRRKRRVRRRGADGCSAHANTFWSWMPRSKPHAAHSAALMNSS